MNYRRVSPTDGFSSRVFDNANACAARKRAIAPAITCQLAFLTLTAPIFVSQISLAETKITTSGNVKAEISYQEKAPNEHSVRLQIFRGKKRFLDKRQPQAAISDLPVVSIAPENKLPVVDLDGNKEPEIIADFFTGGAHCCTYSLIYRYQVRQKRYLVNRFNWGNVGYELIDLNNDKIPEFRSADDRFAYAFASYAASGFPLQIWQYRHIGDKLRL